MKKCIGTVFDSNGNYNQKEYFVFSKDNVINFIIKNIYNSFIITDSGDNVIIKYHFDKTRGEYEENCVFEVSQEYFKYFTDTVYPEVKKIVQEGIIDNIESNNTQNYTNESKELIS